MRRWLYVLLLGLTGCGGDDAAPEASTLSRAELMDPTTCKQCHEDHYREWSGSMHAYASKDLVFIALNRRGQ